MQPATFYIGDGGGDSTHYYLTAPWDNNAMGKQIIKMSGDAPKKPVATPLASQPSVPLLSAQHHSSDSPTPLTSRCVEICCECECEFIQFVREDCCHCPGCPSCTDCFQNPLTACFKCFRAVWDWAAKDSTAPATSSQAAGQTTEQNAGQTTSPVTYQPVMSSTPQPTTTNPFSSGIRSGGVSADN